MKAKDIAGLYAALTKKSESNALMDVEYQLAHDNELPEKIHDKWLESMIADGWSHGKIFDAEKKIDPKLLPYHHLPKEIIEDNFILYTLVKELRHK